MTLHTINYYRLRYQFHISRAARALLVVILLMMAGYGSFFAMTDYITGASEEGRGAV